MARIRRPLVTMIDCLGFGKPARRIRDGLEHAHKEARRVLAARGWITWTPLVPADAFERCVLDGLEELQRAGRSIGDYLEFGVSRGTSTVAAFRAFQRSQLDSRLIGFDSFQGMPPGSEAEGFETGAFYSTLDATLENLRTSGVDLSRVHLVQGWFSETCNSATRDRLRLGKASVIMVDCDIYTATKQALEFAEPHIHDCALVLFDDWGTRERQGSIGQKEAFEELLAAHPELSAEPRPAYGVVARAFMVTRTVE